MFDLALSCLLLASPPPSGPSTPLAMGRSIEAREQSAQTGNTARVVSEEDSGASHVEPPREPAQAGLAVPSQDEKTSGFRRYLSRNLAPSARFLDHGVVQVGVAPGLPSLYRWQVQLGLFDHLSGGVSMHWLEGHERPHVVPQGALAVLRRPAFELGLSYRQVLHTPEEDEEQGFALRTHYMFGSATFSQGHWTAGMDVGAVRFRGVSIDPEAQADVYRWRTLPGGGVFARFGTRRWGVGVQGQMPIWTLELMVDVRFGLFELRKPGGWRLEPRY